MSLSRITLQHQSCMVCMESWQIYRLVCPRSAQIVPNILPSCELAHFVHVASLSMHHTKPSRAACWCVAAEVSLLASAMPALSSCRWQLCRRPAPHRSPDSCRCCWHPVYCASSELEAIFAVYPLWATWQQHVSEYCVQVPAVCASVAASTAANSAQRKATQLRMTRCSGDRPARCRQMACARRRAVHRWLWLAGYQRE